MLVSGKLSLLITPSPFSFSSGDPRDNNRQFPEPLISRPLHESSVLEVPLKFSIQNQAKNFPAGFGAESSLK
jgi:hypothetical protein